MPIHYVLTDKVFPNTDYVDSYVKGEVEYENSQGYINTVEDMSEPKHLKGTFPIIEGFNMSKNDIYKGTVALYDKFSVTVKKIEQTPFFWDYVTQDELFPAMPTHKWVPGYDEDQYIEPEDRFNTTLDNIIDYSINYFSSSSIEVKKIQDYLDDVEMKSIYNTLNNIFGIFDVDIDIGIKLYKIPTWGYNLDYNFGYLSTESIYYLPLFKYTKDFGYLLSSNLSSFISKASSFDFFTPTNEFYKTYKDFTDAELERGIKGLAYAYTFNESYIFIMPYDFNNENKLVLKIIGLDFDTPRSDEGSDYDNNLIIDYSGNNNNPVVKKCCIAECFGITE